MNSHRWAPPEVLSRKEGLHGHQLGSPGVGVRSRGWRAGREGIREAELGGSGQTPRLPFPASPCPPSRPQLEHMSPCTPSLQWPPPHPQDNPKTSLCSPLPRQPCRFSGHRSLLCTCMGTLSPDLRNTAEVDRTLSRPALGPWASGPQFLRMQNGRMGVSGFAGARHSWGVHSDHVPVTCLSQRLAHGHTP